MNIKIKLLHFSILLFLLYLLSFNVCAHDSDIAVTVFAYTYYGSYSGTLKNGFPTGEGTFTCTDGFADFSLSGIWEDGLLQGDAIIQYGDGSYIEATYKKGMISGKVKEFYADGSYRTYSCSDGRPNGLITYYDNSGNPSGFDFFYQMKPIADLKTSSAEPVYSSLMTEESGITPYKISGTVLGTFDDNPSTYVLIQDAKNHLYVGTYKNKTSNKFNQAIVPNLMAGDTITAYGFLQRSDSLSNIEDIYISVPITGQLTSDISSSQTDDIWNSSLNIKDFLTQSTTLPFITLFSADLIDAESFDRLNPSYEYEDIVRNPYLYTDLKCNLTGIVTKARINYDNNTVLINMQESISSNEYFIRYSFSQNDVLPSIGDTITVQGTYRGNDKILKKDIASNDNSGTYIIYPRIHTSSITIL